MADLNPIEVPFNRPCPAGMEEVYMHDAVRRMQISGGGRYARKCEELLGELLSGPRVLLTTSCTHALEMAALLLNLQPGDEVILPSFTFVSTANAFVLRGARPVFADIRPDTLNLDEAQLERLISPRTKAVVPVHYAGVGCEMDAILAVADRHGVPVIEDNAHGLFGTYRGRPLGTFGVLATQSFHETKNVTCGEGGALVLNDRRFVERAEILREKGTDRSRFFRGAVDKYTWIDVGSSYVISDLLAAFLFAQLEARAVIQTKRRRVWEYYHDHLADWAAAHGVQRPQNPAHCEHPSHLYFLVMPTPAQRDGLIRHLRARGIQAVFHYLPLHLSKMGQSFGGRAGDCPVAEHVSACLVRLPFFNDLADRDLERVVRAVREFDEL